MIKIFSSITKSRLKSSRQFYSSSCIPVLDINYIDDKAIKTINVSSKVVQAINNAVAYNTVEIISMFEESRSASVRVKFALNRHNQGDTGISEHRTLADIQMAV